MSKDKGRIGRGKLSEGMPKVKEYPCSLCGNATRHKGGLCRDCKNWEKQWAAMTPTQQQEYLKQHPAEEEGQQLQYEDEQELQAEALDDYYREKYREKYHGE
jgi:predicted ATP-dependent serine protease